MQTPMIADFTYGELSPKLYGRVDQPIYYKGAAKMQNFIPYSVGGFTKRPGMKLIDEIQSSALYIRLYKIVISASTWYLLGFSHHLIRVWTAGIGTATTIVTTYDSSELKALQFAWACPYLFIAHPSHPPAMITWTSPDTLTYTSAIPIVGSTPEYASATTINNNATITLTTTPLAAWVGKPITGSGIQPATTVQSIDAGAKTMVLTKVCIAGASGVIVAISDDTTLPFQSTNNYPSVVACAMQRVWWFSTNTNQQRAWASVVGIWDSYFNMQISLYEKIIYSVQAMRLDVNGNPLDVNNAVVTPSSNTTPAYDTTEETQQVIGDADGIEGDIYSDQNDSVQWACAARDIILGSLSGEWGVPGASNANTFEFDLISRSGSAPIQGMLVSGGVLFIDRPGSRVMLLDWQGLTNPLSPPDTLSRFSDHLFLTNGIQAFEFEKTPFPRLWFLRNDGSLVGCEYDQAANVRAFWPVVTDGTVYSICSCPGTDRDVLYLSILRNGYTTIEALQTQNWTSQPLAYYLDAAVYKQSTTPFTTVTDTLLNALVGKTVSLICDGAYVGTAVVASGPTVTVPSCLKCVVGLPFTASFQSMSIEAGGNFGTSQTRNRTINGIGVKFLNTLDAKIATKSGGTYQQASLGGVDVTIANPTLFSGTEKIAVNTGYADDVYVLIDSDKPLPCTVTAIVPEVVGNE